MTHRVGGFQRQKKQVLWGGGSCERELNKNWEERVSFWGEREHMSKLMKRWWCFEGSSVSERARAFGRYFTIN